MNSFVNFLDKLSKNDTPSSRALIESIKKAYVITESVTFSPDHSEMMKLDYFRKLQDEINDLGSKIFTSDYYYNEKYYQDDEFTKMVDNMIRDYQDKNELFDKYSLNVANTNAAAIIKAMGFVKLAEERDESLSEFFANINQDDNELLSELRSIGSDYEHGSANVFYFEKMIDEMESMKSTMVREPIVSKNAYSGGLDIDRIDFYISKLREIVDFCKNYGITTINWS